MLGNVDLMLINILFHVQYQMLKSKYIDPMDQFYLHNTKNNRSYLHLLKSVHSTCNCGKITAIILIKLCQNSTDTNNFD